MPQVLEGVYAASLTPLHADQAIDYAALADHLRWLLANGCDGVALFGTTGEASSFSVRERLDALETVAEAGVPVEKLLVGTGCCALPDTVALTRHAVEHGAAGVLMLPPFYYKGVSDDGLFAAFDQVIQQVGAARLRIVLYHFPKLSGVPFSNALVERLVTRYPDTVFGMKDSSGDLGHMQATIRAFPGLRLFAGTERYLLDVLEAGGAGCITATTNVTCALAAEIYRRWQHKDMREEQAYLTAVRGAIEAFPMAAVLKHLMAEATGRAAWFHLRPPLVALREAQAAALREALDRLGFQVPALTK